MNRLVAWLLLAAGAASAADWQATGSVGFGKYHYVGLTSPAGTGDAGIGARYILDAAIGRALGGHLALEAGWTFQDGDFEIKSGSQKTAFDAHANSIHGDVYYFFRNRETKLRPFVDAGAGVKLYQGIESVRPRPLAAYGAFAHAVDARPLIVAGGGLEWALTSRWAIRAAVRDFSTPFPASVIVPAPGVSAGGWLQDTVVTVGISLR